MTGKRKRTVAVATTRTSDRKTNAETDVGIGVGNDATKSTIDPPPVVQTTKVLQLPEEIQLGILSYILASEPGRPVQLRSHIHNPVASESTSQEVQYGDLKEGAVRAKKRKKSQPLGLNILLVCRAWYFTGLKSFYSGNIFYFHSISELSQFVAPLESDRRQHIRRLIISIVWGFDNIFREPKAAVVKKAKGAAEQLMMAIEALPVLESVSVYGRGVATAGCVVLMAEMQNIVRDRWGGKADVLDFRPYDKWYHAVW